MMIEEPKHTEPTRLWASALLAVMIALATAMLETQTGGAAFRRTPPVILRLEAPIVYGRKRAMKLRPLSERLLA